MVVKAIKYIIAWFRIPKGQYCQFASKFKCCPYYRPNIAPIKMGDGTMAYCKYLDKTDLDIIRTNGSHIYSDEISKRKIEFTEEELISMGFASLLWDGCKECGIKEND